MTTMEAARWTAFLLAFAEAKPEWHDRAACKGHPERAFTRGKGAPAFARDYCDGCPVRAECLTDSVAAAEVIGDHIAGVWAGSGDPATRRAMLHRTDR